jgi:hypothetical protein
MVSTTTFRFFSTVLTARPVASSPFSRTLSTLKKQVAEQRRCPVVPGLGAGGHGVGNGQQVEHFQQLRLLDRPGHGDRRFFIVDVPPGGRQDQQQMMLDEKGNGFGVGGVGAFLQRMLSTISAPRSEWPAVGSPLPMSWSRAAHNRTFFFFQFLIQPVGEGVYIGPASVSKSLQNFYGVKQMPGHRVKMILIELDPVHHRFELRDKPCQKTRVQHLVEHFEGSGDRIRMRSNCWIIWDRV